MEDKWEKANKVAEATKEPDSDDIKLAKIELTDFSNDKDDAGDPNTPKTTRASHAPNKDHDAQTDTPTESSGLPASIKHVLHPELPTEETTSSKGFLFAYITSVFSSFALLFGAVFLGYSLFDHFINSPVKHNPDQYFYFDLAPFYLSMMASMMVFVALYVFTSRYAAHCVANDHVSPRDWRVYRVVYALFAAYMVAAGAGVLASILYIPLAQALVAEDMTAKQISILVLGALHTLVWIGLLVWQEYLVKRGKQSIVHGTIVAVAVIILVILVGIFPIGSKTNDRFDHRVTTDLETIESAINRFAADAKGELPAGLEQLELDGSPVQSRLGQYRYILESETQNSAEKQTETDDFLSDISYYDASDDLDIFKSKLSGDGLGKTYQLCATFKTDTLAKTRPDSIFDTLSKTTAQARTSASDEFDRHKKGEACFERSAYAVN